MIIPQFIKNEYVAPVTLETLGSTLNTLEEGHKEAIKTSSELKNTIANFDLNEQEDEWKQNKINEIEQIVDNNTIYGNSYATLDNLIEQIGNITSDAGLKGRTEAQKDYKKFIESIENDNSLPQDYKDFFLDNNKYYYEDKYDKNGKIIGGTKWKPNISPTKIVPLSEIIIKGISLAAKESGGGNITRWLDKNGSITNDPNEAFDGEVYNTTTNHWERLSREKIWQGINSMIETTPGAKESINQDYKIALWKHNKEVELYNKYKANIPVIDDITDKNGIILSPKEYLFKRIDPATQAASYYNVVNNTTYGKGLASYNAAKARINSLSSMTLNNANMLGTGTPIEIKNNAAASYLNAKNITSDRLKNFYKLYTGKSITTMNDDIISELENIINKDDGTIDSSNKLNILRDIRLYKEANLNLKSYTDIMSSEDKKNFEFATRIASGGELLSSKEGGSKYDDEIIKDINELYGDKGVLIKIKLSPKTSSIFADIIKGDKYTGFENLGITFNNGVISIPKTSMNVLPLVSSAIITAEKRANVGVFPTIYSAVVKNSRYTVSVYDEQNNELISDKQLLSMEAGAIGTPDHYGYRIKDLADLYNKGEEINKNLTNKYNVNPTSSIYSSINIDSGTFTEGSLRELRLKGLIDETTYNKEVKHFSEARDREILDTDFSQLKMYYLDKGYKKEIDNSTERFNIGQEIIQAVKDKRCNIVPSIIPGEFNAFGGDPITGYNISIIPKTDTNGEAKGEIKKIYVPNLVLESVADQIRKSPKIQAWNTISTVGGTRTTKIITDNNTNPILGNIAITGLGQDMFNVHILGSDITIDNDQAVSLVTAINNYNGIKDRYKSEKTGELDNEMQKTFKESAAIISKITNADPDAVFMWLGNDLKK